MVAIPESSPSVEVNIYNDGEKRVSKASGSLMARENYEMGGNATVDNWLETLKADSNFQRVQQDAEGLGILDVEPKELNQILQDVRLKQNRKRALIDAKKSKSYDGLTLANIYNENDPVLNALREGYTPDIPRIDKESLETRIKTFLGFEDEEAPTKKPEIDRVYTKADMEMLRRSRDPDAMVEHANASGLAEQQGGQMANEERPKNSLGGMIDDLQSQAASAATSNSKKPNVITAAPDLKTIAALDYATTTEGQIALDKQALDPTRQMAKDGGNITKEPVSQEREKTQVDMYLTDPDFQIGNMSETTIYKMGGGDEKAARKFIEDMAEAQDLMVKYYDGILNTGTRRARKNFIERIKKSYDRLGGHNFRSVNSDLIDSYKSDRSSKEFIHKKLKLQEGGMAMPPELMQQPMPTEEPPVDTYPNIPPEEMAEVEASQLPDDEMEDNYLDFIVSESLSGQEQQYLMESLEADPQLSSIIDKLVLTASEFTGQGEVDGPGTGVSDSIPARLSDGEFVFTRKATDQIGADNLQTMMDDAERAYDGGLQKYALGGAVDDTVLGGAVKDTTPLMDEKVDMYGTNRQQDEMRKQMMYANRMPSIIGT